MSNDAELLRRYADAELVASPVDLPQAIVPAAGLQDLLTADNPQAREAAASAIKQFQPMKPEMSYTSLEMAPAREALKPMLTTLDEERRVRVKAALDVFGEMEKITWRGSGSPTRARCGLAQHLRDGPEGRGPQ